MDWNDPSARARLIDHVGPEEYERLQRQHFKDSTVETVNGHGIHPVSSRYGRLLMVGTTGKAFRTIEEARAFAEKTPS